jgi:hypothetical protein
MDMMPSFLTSKSQQSLIDMWQPASIIELIPTTLPSTTSF